MTALASTTRLPRVGSGAAPPLLQQWLLNYALGYAYDRTAGPWLRQRSERLLGRVPTPAYRPALTPGYVARDLTTAGLGYAVGQQGMRLLRHVTVGGSMGNSLLSSGGLAGQQAMLAAAGGLTARTLGRIAGEATAMTLAFTMLDALLSNALGPRIENGVNKLFGVPVAPASRSGKDGTIPLHLMRVDAEQAARNFARNAVGASVYTTASATLGAEIARATVASVSGPGGAVLGALASALASSMLAGVVDAWVGERAANTGARVLRAGRRMLGRPSVSRPRADVVPVPGDRITGSVRGVLVPFATAAMTGQQSQFTRSLAISVPVRSAAPRSATAGRVATTAASG